MSWKACGWAKSQRLGSPAAKSILLCLADSTPEPSYFCRVSQAELADYSECSARTVWQWLVRLEKWGLITRSRRYVEQGNSKKSIRGGARAADGFNLNLEVIVEDGRDRLAREKKAPEDIGESPVLLATVATRTEPLLLATSDAPTRNHCDTYKEEPILEPNLSARAGARERGNSEDQKKAFEQAYRAWPTSAVDSSRGRALKAWLELTDEEQQAAVSEAGRYIGLVRSFGRKHLCSFATYLTDKLWSGMVPPAAPADRSRPPPAEPPRPTTKTWAQRKLEEIELAKALQPRPGSISDQVGGG